LRYSKDVGLIILVTILKIHSAPQAKSMTCFEKPKISAIKIWKLG
jgi:hypothetical protein